MNIEELLDALNREGINPNAYTLDGGHPPERYVLDSRAGRWAVYYSERGLEQGLREFLTESEACEALLQTLREDTTTHFHLVVGPLPADEADVAFAQWKNDHRLAESALAASDIRIDNPVFRAEEGPVRRYWVRGTKLPHA